MPIWNVLVGDTGGNIKHDDTALAVDIVSITEASKLLLSCSIPDIKLDVSKVLPNVNDFIRILWVGHHTVLNARGCTSTPRVAMYFFSNSPVK